MKANPEKFQFMILSKKSYQPQKLSVNTFTIDESDEVELLGVTIDKELNFSKHIDKLCRNAQYKICALKRIRKYLSLEKAKMLGNTFIDSQFNYTPLIWMFCRSSVKWTVLGHPRPELNRIIFSPKLVDRSGPL